MMNEDSPDFPVPQNSQDFQVSQDYQDLTDVREKWLALSRTHPEDGVAWNIIPSLQWDQIFSVDASSIVDLTHKVGKINCASLVDARGNMYAEDAPENVVAMAIPPELFQLLISVFGVNGSPVVRNILVKPDSDSPFTIEKFPPFFVVHLLSSDAPTTRSSRYSQINNQNRMVAFSLSQTATFADLISTVKNHLFKPAKSPVNIRLWFASTSNSDELPFQVSPAYFVESVAQKKLVVPQIYLSSLYSQGIRSSKLHLVVEPLERNMFPLDSYINTVANSIDNDSTTVSAGGRCGLSNLGNTCYMNSALQCLVHLQEVNSYFLYDIYSRELNRTNPLGYKGDVAVAFSGLLHKLFDPTAKGQSHVTPREFKYTIGRHSSVFHGYQQQDSQEFVSWLLDALHEDLNRIHQKPYCEKPELKDEDVDNKDAIKQLANTCWDQYKKRNDSVIVDLFTGLYQSTLVCPDCSKTSMTFDPFNDITLPMPVNKKWYHELIIVDLSGNGGSERKVLLKLEVELNKTSNFDDLIAYLSLFLKVAPEHLFLFEHFRNFFYRNFQENRTQYKFLPISELISDADVIVAYVIPHDPNSEIIVPVLNTVHDEDSSYNIAEPFGLPLFITLNKETETKSFGTIRRKLENVVKSLTNGDIESKYREITSVSPGKTSFSAEDFPGLVKPIRSIPDDTVMVEEEEEETDSIVSLANPEVDADFGFEIKYYVDEPAKSPYHRGPRRYFGAEQDVPSVGPLHIPRGRPQLANLPVLSSKLPEIKRRFYHYPKYLQEQRLRQENESMVTAPEDPCSETDKNDYIMVNNDGETEEKPQQQKQQQQQATDEDSESDTNWDSVQPLFDSVDHLEGPPPNLPTNESERDFSSETHSPIDPPSQQNEGIVEDAELVNGKTMLVCEWDPVIYQQFFLEPQDQAWENIPEIPNPELAESKRKVALQQKSSISLYDCLRNFSTPEVLGDHDLWYCPRCKDHKRATKTIQIWKTGDILAFHLKRFSSARAFSDKISMVVDFPIEGLDMNDYVASNEKSNSLIYDLVAVDNHYGGLGGGHYTASVKNFRDDKWYYFNDSGVSELNDPSDCISGAAYLLFYKKRKENGIAGGENVESLLSQGRAAYQEKLERTRQNVKAVTEQVDLYTLQKHELQLAEEEIRRGQEKVSGGDDDDNDGEEEEEEEEDLYEDANSNGGRENIGGNGKKTRSPMTEQQMKFEFENQRKQRLISKDYDLPRSVNISHGYSSSVSNLASPMSSEEE